MKYIFPLCAVILLVTATPAWAVNAPGNFRCTDCSSTTLTWAWNNVAGENGYTIFDNATDNAVVSDLPANVLTTVETGLSPNATYARYIKAYKTSNIVTDCPALYSCCVFLVGGKYDGEWWAGVWADGSMVGGFVKFDLSGFPAGTIVTNVRLFAYCVKRDWDVNTDIRKISVDPVPATDIELFADLLTSDVSLFNNSNIGKITGYRSQDLWTVADSWVEEAINSQTGCCSLAVMDDGLFVPNNFCRFREYNCGTVGQRPYLEVTWENNSFSLPSNVAEACTLAVIPFMSNSALTFTFENSNTITALVGLNGNPPGTVTEMFYARGDADGPTEAFQSAGTMASGYSWNVSGLISDSSYWFLAKALNRTGIETDCCAITAWSTNAGGLSAPSGLSAYDCASGSISWRWTDNSISEDGFELLRNGGDVVITLGPDATYTVETGLSENTQYTRLARAFMTPGPVYSGNSNVVPACTLCEPPTDLEISISDVTYSSMKVRVATCPNPTANSTAAQFHEAAAAAPDSTWVTDIEIGDFVYTAGSLDPNSAYSWQARYRNGDGIMTTYNTTALMRCTLLADPIPGNLSITSDDASRMVLTYTTPPNGSAGQTGSFFEFVLGAGGGDNSGWQNGTYNYEDTGLAPNETYSYRVQLRNAEGIETNPSGTKARVTLGAVPGGPTFSSITTSSVTVSWSGNGNPAWTIFELAGSSGGPWTSLANTASLSYSDTSLAANTTYSYRIRSINLEGIPSQWSAVDSFQTLPSLIPVVTILSAPVLIYGNTAAPPLVFVCDRDADYRVELGGNGTPGSGIALYTDFVNEGISQNIVFDRDVDLNPDDAALNIFVICQEPGNAANFGYANCIVFDDHIAPVSAVSFPEDGQVLARVDAINGTASDSGAGGGNVGLVELVLYNVTDDLYYDNATSDFSAASPVLFAVTGTDFWSFNSSAVVFDDNSKYMTYARSIDTVGNAGPISDNVSFTIDVTLPTITIESPDPIPPTIIGPTVDAAVQWRVDMDCDYFLRVGGNGSIASGIDVGNGSMVADNSIISIVPATFFPDDVTERLYIIARNPSFSVTYIFREFHDDETAPVTSVRTTFGGAISTLDLITGVSEDAPAGLASVELAIRDSNGLYYSPASGIFEPGQTYFMAGGLASWQYDTSAVPFAKGLSYTVSIRVTDKVGNVEERDVGTFVIYSKQALTFMPKKKKKGGCSLIEAEMSEPPDMFGYFLPFLLMLFVLILLRRSRGMLIPDSSVSQ